LVLIRSIALVSLVTSCQVLFGEFEVVDESDLGGNGGTAGTSAETGGGGAGATGGTIGCALGEAVCQGNQLLTCENGSWAQRPCASAAHCDATLGRCRDCLPGEGSCFDDKTVRSCDPVTGRFTDELCGDGLLCDEGLVRCVACLSGTARCVGDDLEVCNAAQDGWELQTCPDTCVQDGLHDYCAGGAGGSG